MEHKEKLSNLFKKNENWIIPVVSTILFIGIIISFAYANLGETIEENNFTEIEGKSEYDLINEKIDLKNQEIYSLMDKYGRENFDYCYLSKEDLDKFSNLTDEQIGNYYSMINWINSNKKHLEELEDYEEGKEIFIISSTKISLAKSICGFSSNENSNLGYEQLNTEIEEYIDVSLYDLISYFSKEIENIDDKATSLQKTERLNEIEEEFNEDYKGKWIKDSAKIYSISNSLYDNKISVGLYIGLGEQYGKIEFLDFDISQKDELLKYKKGDEINFEGELESFDYLFGTVSTKIVEAKVV
jgi:hypothetical protein